MWSFYKSTRCSLDHLKVCWRTWSSGFGVHAAVSKANWGHIKNKTAIQIVFIKFDSLSLSLYIYIYIYIQYLPQPSPIFTFTRRFYPKWLTVHSGYACFVSMYVPWESNPQPFALLTQCSTTEPHEHTLYPTDMALFYVGNIHNIFWSTHALSIIRYIQYYTFKWKLDHLYNTFFFVSKVRSSMCSVSILVFMKTTEYKQKYKMHPYHPGVPNSNSTTYETTLLKQCEGVWCIPQRT